LVQDACFGGETSILHANGLTSYANDLTIKDHFDSISDGTLKSGVLPFFFGLMVQVRRISSNQAYKNTTFLIDHQSAEPNLHKKHYCGGLVSVFGDQPCGRVYA